MSEIIASVSGIRGIIGDNLTPSNITKFVSAFAEYCKKEHKGNKYELVILPESELIREFKEVIPQVYEFMDKHSL